MDKLIPIPTHAELLEQTQQKLGANFPISNYRKGGAWYTLLMLLFQVYIELKTLAQQIINNSLVVHAGEGWLELSAADYSKIRKQPQKTQGVVTLLRTATDSVVRIKKGHIFKTSMDATGQEYRYFVTDETIMGTGQSSCNIPVEAEKPGAAYNMPPNKIIKSILHLETVDTITNNADWLTREGSDLEELELFRQRTLSAWSELASQPTRDKYRAVCEAVPGVLAVNILDEHPRGQGTMDIVVTAVAGQATEQLLNEVRAAALKISGPSDDILVRSSETVTQAITVTLLVDRFASTEGLVEQAEYILRQMLAVTNRTRLHELYLSDINHQLRTGLPTAQNVKVIVPAADVQLQETQVVVLGTVTVHIERG